MADDLDENQTNAQTDNPNSGSQGVAQQALDDLTVLSDVGTQNMGETRLNVARAVDVNDAALGSLATIHQGSNEGEQIQQGLDLQVGEIVLDDISVDQGKTTVIETPPVAELDGAAAEAAQDVAVDTRLNVRIQDDLTEQNVIFGDPIVVEQTAEEAAAAAAAAETAAVDVTEIVPETALEEVFVDAPPAIGGIYFDDPATSDPTLVPLGSPQAINEDGELKFVIDAVDPDGGAVNISFSQPTHGSITINDDGSYSYTPDENYFSSYSNNDGTFASADQDSFTVFVSDDEGNTISQTVTIDIKNVDDESVFTMTGGTGDEDTTITGTISATDIDGAIVSYELVGDAAHGSVTVNADGSYSFVPAADWNGTDSFTVRVYDDKGGFSDQEVTVEVAAVEDSATSDGIIIDDPSTVVVETTPVESVTIAEDSTINFTIDVNESADGGPIAISFADNPNGSVIINDDGSYTFTPAGDFTGATELTYTLTEADGSSITNTVTINVGAVEDEAVVTTTGGTGSEDTVVTGTISATDVDGGVVSIELVGDAAHGTVELNSDGTYSFTPNADWNGTDSFTVVVTDANGGTTEQTITVNVGAVEDEAVVTVTGGSGAEDNVVTGTISVTDADGGVASIEVLGDGPAHGTVELNSDGTYSFTPNDDWNGTDSFTVVVTDANGGTTEQTITVNVEAVDDAAVVTATGGEGSEDNVVTGSISATDIDGGIASIELVGDAAHGTVELNSDGTYSFIDGDRTVRRAAIVGQGE
ncbi:MAG: tandem-95 repeat protein, partial [Alphaproteobacteria bacterium]|nr:tandem-95 repeat protein [Alphaproteobacteria bacterium]